MKNYTLPKEFAEKWVAALRSGDYKQTTGQLKEENCYCSIGVYCHVNGVEISRDGGNPVIDGEYKDYYSGDFMGMQKEFVKDIVYLNDHDEKPFPELADWIEQNVEFV